MSGLHDGYCCELAAKTATSTPAGTTCDPWLHTGTVLFGGVQGIPSARSTPVQFGSVSPGHHGTQVPAPLPQVALHTLWTIPTQVESQARPDNSFGPSQNPRRRGADGLEVGSEQPQSCHFAVVGRIAAHLSEPF